ncbi:MAG: DUF6364 family protein [Verrucomicrobiales bacterium]
MKNITVKIDDETYRQARLEAAKRETSVSALVREYLQKLANEEESIDTTYKERRKALQKLWEMADAREQPGPAAMKCREAFYDEELR